VQIQIGLRMELWSAVNVHNGGVETQNGTRRACRQVVEDSHNFDEQNLDPNFVHSSEKLDTDPHLSYADP
jgi:hypothetical protein